MQTAVHLYNLPIPVSSYLKDPDQGISNYFVIIYLEVSVLLKNDKATRDLNTGPVNLFQTALSLISFQLQNVAWLNAEVFLDLKCFSSWA